MARSFIDTNVLVYADDAFDSRKQGIAIDLLARLRTVREGVLSPQVLQEYYVNAVRKLKLPEALARQRGCSSGASSSSSLVSSSSSGRSTCTASTTFPSGTP